MLRHIVLFRFKPDTSQAARTAMADGLAELPSRIPQIRAWSQGRNVVQSDRNYDFALVADFDSLADMKIYQAHRDHQAVVAELILPVVESLVVADFDL